MATDKETEALTPQQAQDAGIICLFCGKRPLSCKCGQEFAEIWARIKAEDEGLPQK